MNPQAELKRTPSRKRWEILHSMSQEKKKAKETII